MSELAELLGINDNVIIQEYNQNETDEYRKLWIKTFCKNKQGVNIKSYLWHIFSSSRYHSVCKKEAKTEYDNHTSSEYVILSNNDELAILVTEKPYNFNNQDFYVFPKNMAWTMAFTHEDDWLGPFFAKHVNYKKLNSRNNCHYKLNQKKKIEIEKAKKNGWL